MTDLATSTSLISATTYDPANRLSSITGSVYNESRSYNTMGQLTGLTSNSVSMVYNYSATQNNGKITGQTDNVSGEQVVYAYDAINRLATAASTTSSWGQSYSYDGFGNLTDQTVTAGSAPSLHVVYNASNNRQTTDCSDTNGNINSAAACSGAPYSYDVENRIVWVPGNTAYAYAPGNKRVWRGTTSASHLTLDELTFWSVTGQKLATYTIQGGDPTVVYSPPSIGVVIATSNYYFGRKLIKNGSGYVGSDRVGSVGKYYPFGQEKPSATTNGTEKFTGYFRDAETTLDYAKNRYHQPGMGRFMTVDPYLNSAGPQDPGSWNRYAYTRGDPVNRYDRTGKDDGDCFDETGCGTDPGDPDPDPISQVCPGGFYFDESTEDCEPVSYYNEAPPPCDAQFLTQGVGGYSASDINLAARVIFAESSGNYTEDVYIADVIVNRLKNKMFSGGTLTTLTQVVSVPGQFNAITPPGPNWPFTNSGPGLYQSLQPADCNNLKTAIAAMTNVAQNGATANYNMFVAAGGHRGGTVVGGSVFWTVSPPPKPPRKRKGQ
jgi:RHS repeat-associated protein